LTHGKDWSTRPVHHTLCRAYDGVARDKEWSMCRAPPQAHGKGTILAALFGRFAVHLPHGARQIDQIFYFFFLFFTSKNSQKPYT
jgi:hypothetical protein